MHKQIIKGIFNLGLVSFCVLLLVEPYVRKHYAANDVSLVSNFLAVWLLLSLFVFVIYIPQIIKDSGLTLGFASILVLLIRALGTGEFVYELLPVSYSVIFMSTSLIASNVKTNQANYDRLILYLVLAAGAGMLYGNLLAFGVVDSQQIIIGEQRYSFVFDGNAAVLSIAIATAATMCHPARPVKVLAGVVVFLAMIRLISFGSKGPMLISLLIVLLEVVLYRGVGSGRNGHLLIFAVFALSTLAVTLFEPMSAYFDLFIGRFDNSDTWFARMSEAENDLAAFSHRPMLGWGRDVPTLTALDEPSYGHFTPTGMLARVGLVGTVGLGFFYFSYFLGLRRRLHRTFPEPTVVTILFSGIVVFVMLLVVMGNPLLLFPAWAFLPLIFPSFVPGRSAG